MKKISLIQLTPGHKAVMSAASGSGLSKKLMDMGLYPGKEVVKLSHIGLKGPVVIKFGRSIVALGHGVAEKVTVEVK